MKTFQSNCESNGRYQCPSVCKGEGNVQCFFLFILHQHLKSKWIFFVFELIQNSICICNFFFLIFFFNVNIIYMEIDNAYAPYFIVLSIISW